jgi:hypothetical protein
VLDDAAGAADLLQATRQDSARTKATGKFFMTS